MKHIHILVILLLSATTLFGQRIKPDKRIRLAPDTTQAHALISDHAGKYQHTLLYHWIDSVFHFSDSTIWVKEPTHIYYLDPVSVGTERYRPAYQLTVDGTGLFRDHILIENPSASLFFSNDTSNIDAGFILLNDSTFSVTSISRIGWGGNGISTNPEESLDIPGTIKMRGLESTTPTGATRMLVVDTVAKVAFMADIPQSGFDSTYIYAALADTAADIRTDDSDHQQLSLGSDTIYLERGGFVVVPSSFDTTHIYQALVDSASDIRDDMPHYWELYVEGSYMRDIGDDMGDIVDFVSGDNSIQISNLGSQVNFSTTDADPTNELFDSTYIYQALVDTAAELRSVIDSAGISSLNFNNGITKTDDTVQLGGVLIKSTLISSPSTHGTAKGPDYGLNLYNLRHLSLTNFVYGGAIIWADDGAGYGEIPFIEGYGGGELLIGVADTFEQAENKTYTDLHPYSSIIINNKATGDEITLPEFENTRDDAGMPENIISTNSTGGMESHKLADILGASDSTWLFNGDSLYANITSAGKVGIGTTIPEELLHLQATADPGIKLTESGGPANHLIMSNINASTAKFDKTNSSGSVLLDFFPNPSDGTSTAKTRFFRNTNTTGRVAMDIHKGNNTSAVNCSLSGNEDSYVNKSLGDFGVGTSAPGTKLHVTGGNIYVEDDGAAVILTSPNGTCYEVTVDNSGNLVTTSVTCP